MAKTISLIGLDPAELPWLRLVIWLLRHPDHDVAELTRQALLYLEAASSPPGPAQPKIRDHVC
jgi:hypothetical protein